MLSAGAYVESLMFSADGQELRSQGEAIALALPDLVEMGQVEAGTSAALLRQWHARYRATHGLGAIKRGRKTK
jgi:hypothetical protein